MAVCVDGRAVTQEVYSQHIDPIASPISRLFVSL